MATYYALLPQDAAGHPERRPTVYPILTASSADDIRDETGLAHFTPMRHLGGIAQYDIKIDVGPTPTRIETKTVSIVVAPNGTIALFGSRNGFCLEKIADEEVVEKVRMAAKTAPIAD